MSQTDLSGEHLHQAQQRREILRHRPSSREGLAFFPLIFPLASRSGSVSVRYTLTV
jgi:hypothetical protein